MDHYPTPSELAERIVNRIAETFKPVSILEPSAGTGVFVRACAQAFPLARLYAIEPDPRFSGTLSTTGSSVAVTTVEKCFETTDLKFDLIVGNPPYLLAEEHIKILLGRLLAGGRLYFLLRLAFLETAKRKEFWHNNKPHTVTVLHERPSFCASHKCKQCDARKTTGPKDNWECPCGGRVVSSRTDSTAYAVFEWRNEPTKETKLDWM